MWWLSAVRREFEAHHDRFSFCWIADQNSHFPALNSWIVHPGQLIGFHDYSTSFAVLNDTNYSIMTKPLEQEDAERRVPALGQTRRFDAPFATSGSTLMNGHLRTGLTSLFCANAPSQRRT